MTGIDHPDEEELAALADGRLDPADAEPIEQHLADCRTCMAAYADAVRYRAGWLASPEAFAPTPGLVGDSMAMLRHGRVPQGAAAHRAVMWRRGAWAMGALGLVFAVVLVARTVDRSRAQESLPAPIRVALGELSGRGLVLPGGEAGALPRGPVLRSGFDPSPELEAAVRQAMDRFNTDARAAAYPAAAGLHACGRADDARAYAEAGLRHDSSDVNLLILRAAIAYRASDLDLAERCLRRALALRGDHPVAALDLGIVLAERERRAEAMRLFERAARHGTPPLAARARREAEALQAR